MWEKLGEGGWGSLGEGGVKEDGGVWVREE